MAQEKDGWVVGVLRSLGRLFGRGASPIPERKDAPVDAHGAVVDPDDESIIGSGQTTREFLDRLFGVPNERKPRYEFFDELDQDMLAGILDMYAEEAGQFLLPDEIPEEYRKLGGGAVSTQILVRSDNKEIEQELNNLLRRLRISWDTTPFLRSIAKYGDLFARIRTNASGVFSMALVTNPADISRKESPSGDLLGYTYKRSKNFRISKSSSLSYPWDFIHFRNTWDLKNLPYGTSLIHAAGRAAKLLQMSEDSALMHRLLRHPDRLLHTIDTGEQDLVESFKTVRRYQRKFRNLTTKDPVAGGYDHRRVIMSTADDIFLPVGGESRTSIDKLPGSVDAPNIYDLDYYMNKIRMLTRVPKAYMEGEDANVSKADLSKQNARFSRTVHHLQDVFKLGIRELCEIHLDILRMTNPEYDWTREGQDFRLEMTRVSYTAEIEWLELMSLRLDIGESIMSMGAASQFINPDKVMSYVLKSVLQLPKSEIRKMVRSTPNPALQSPQESFLSALEKDERLTQEEAKEAKKWINNPEFTRRVHDMVRRKERRTVPKDKLKGETPLPSDGGMRVST